MSATAKLNHSVRKLDEMMRRGFSRLEDHNEVLRKELVTFLTDLRNMRFVVLERELEHLEAPLQERLLLTIVPERLGSKIQHWIVRNVIVIVTDETPFISEAASCCCGIISLRELLDREPTRCAQFICDELIQRELRHLPHGWLLLLRENGQHEHRPLIE